MCWRPLAVRSGGRAVPRGWQPRRGHGYLRIVRDRVGTDGPGQEAGAGWLRSGGIPGLRAECGRMYAQAPRRARGAEDAGAGHMLQRL